MAEPKIIKFQEHSTPLEDSEKNLSDSEKDEIRKLEFKSLPDDYMGEPAYLGISLANNKLQTNYYIGATWLLENQVAAVVVPKIENIDYLKMFSDALSVNTKNESDYFSKYYGIEWDKPEIQIDSSLNILTPLIVIHYISVLKKLATRGLKKGYVYRQENLQSKVKGHILFQKQFRKNIINKREDKIFCGFQEYTDDIPENRLLKKALLFSERAINNYESLKEQEIYNQLCIDIKKLLVKFENVSEKIETYEIKSFKFNKLFSEYTEAIKVAKTILRRFDYSIEKTRTQKENSVLPFWIDMPRLYELYVYKQLNESYPNGDVQFQVEGYYKTKVDYIIKSKHLILDAKYKPKYEKSQSGIIGDIREICGYARDAKILNKLGMENKNEVVKCVILYPTISSKDSTSEELEELDKEPANESENKQNELDFSIQGNKAEKIKGFIDFYKLKIDLPKLNAK